ncbi:MAG: response regulator, partial [Dehalococcoidia bacterium]
MLARRLARRGYDVLSAANDEAGMALTRAERPDLVLLDASLPGAEGWEVARQLKADPDLAATPVIALTSYGMAGDRELAAEAGCAEYEVK